MLLLLSSLVISEDEIAAAEAVADAAPSAGFPFAIMSEERSSKRITEAVDLLMKGVPKADTVCRLLFCCISNSESKLNSKCLK